MRRGAPRTPWWSRQDELHRGNIRATLEHTTKRWEPRVIATYKFGASRTPASRTTETSASNPFRSKVLPTARFGSDRPRRRFCSRAPIAASRNVFPSVPSHPCKALMHARSTAGRCVGTPPCFPISTNKLTAARGVRLVLNRSAARSASDGGRRAAPRSSTPTLRTRSAEPTPVITEPANVATCWSASAPRKSRPPANRTRSRRSTASTVTAPGIWLAKRCWLDGFRPSPITRTAPSRVGALARAARSCRTRSCVPSR